MTMVMEFLQNIINSALFYSFHRKHRAAIFFFHSDDNIPTSHIIDVIGKSADCPDYFTWVIVSFILNP